MRFTSNDWFVSETRVLCLRFVCFKINLFSVNMSERLDEEEEDINSSLIGTKQYWNKCYQKEGCTIVYGPRGKEVCGL